MPWVSVLMLSPLDAYRVTLLFVVERAAFGSSNLRVEDVPLRYLLDVNINQPRIGFASVAVRHAEVKIIDAVGNRSPHVLGLSGRRFADHLAVREEAKGA